MIAWSEPLYSADWSTASVGAARIGFIIPPNRPGQPWRWHLCVSGGGFQSGGDVTDEESARASVRAAWESFCAGAGLVMQRPDDRPWLRFRLPLPPSIWDLYQGFGKHRKKSSAYKKWLTDAGWFFKPPATPIDRPFDIVIAMERPHGAMDVDNRLKPVLDCMQLYKVIKNDNLCESAGIRWQPDLGAECIAELRECAEVPKA